MAAIKWTKPNGTEIETRDTPEIVEYAASLDWKRKAAAKKAAPKKSKAVADE